jgi:hypothetical protein
MTLIASSIAAKLNEHPSICLFILLGALGTVYVLGWRRP